MEQRNLLLITKTINQPDVLVLWKSHHPNKFPTDEDVVSVGDYNILVETNTTKQTKKGSKIKWSKAELLQAFLWRRWESIDWMGNTTNTSRHKFSTKFFQKDTPNDQRSPWWKQQYTGWIYLFLDIHVQIMDTHGVFMWQYNTSCIQLPEKLYQWLWLCHIQKIALT